MFHHLTTFAHLLERAQRARERISDERRVSHPPGPRSADYRAVRARGQQTRTSSTEERDFARDRVKQNLSHSDGSVKMSPLNWSVNLSPPAFLVSPSGSSVADGIFSSPASVVPVPGW